MTRQLTKRYRRYKNKNYPGSGWIDSYIKAFIFQEIKANCDREKERKKEKA